MRPRISTCAPMLRRLGMRDDGGRPGDLAHRHSARDRKRRLRAERGGPVPGLDVLRLVVPVLAGAHRGVLQPVAGGDDRVVERRARGCAQALGAVPAAPGRLLDRHRAARARAVARRRGARRLHRRRRIRAAGVRHPRSPVDRREPDRGTVARVRISPSPASCGGSGGRSLSHSLQSSTPGRCATTRCWRSCRWRRCGRTPGCGRGRTAT